MEYETANRKGHNYKDGTDGEIIGRHYAHVDCPGHADYIKNMVPADVRILAAKDLFISQAALTGESAPVEKQGQPCRGGAALAEVPNLAFMGSNVVSGSARAVAVAVGNDTMLGGMHIALPNGVENGVHQLVKVALSSMVALFGTYQIAANGVAQSIWSLASIMRPYALFPRPDSLHMWKTAQT